MPSMVWLGRRWSTGSDEYVCSAITLLVFHAALLIASLSLSFDAAAYSTRFTRLVNGSEPWSAACTVVSVCAGQQDSSEIAFCYSDRGLRVEAMCPGGPAVVKRDVLRSGGVFGWLVMFTGFAHIAAVLLFASLLVQTNRGTALQVDRRKLVPRTLTALLVAVTAAHVILAVPTVTSALLVSRTNGQLEFTLAVNDIAACWTRYSNAPVALGARRKQWQAIAADVSRAFDVTTTAPAVVEDSTAALISALGYDGDSLVGFLFRDALDSASMEESSRPELAFVRCLNDTAPCLKPRELTRLANSMERGVAKLMASEIAALILFLLLFVVLRFDAFGRLTSTIDENTYHAYWARRLSCVFCCWLTARPSPCARGARAAYRRQKRRTEQELIDDVAWSAVGLYQNLDLTPMDITAAATALALHQRAVRKERYAALAAVYYRAHANSRELQPAASASPGEGVDAMATAETPSAQASLTIPIKRIAQYHAPLRGEIMRKVASGAAVEVSELLSHCESDVSVLQLFEPYMHAAYGWPHFLQVTPESCCESLAGLFRTRKQSPSAKEETVNFGLHRAAAAKVLGFEAGHVDRALLLEPPTDGASTLSGILHADFTSDVLQPAFIVTVDRIRGAVVVAIRGTDSVTDVLTDIVATRVAIHLRTRPNVEFYCHKGMLEGARAVLASLQRQNLLVDMATHPSLQSLPVIVTGHSLGAGCAAILAVLLRDLRLCDLSVSQNPTPAGRSTAATPSALEKMRCDSDVSAQEFPFRQRLECVVYSPPGTVYCPALAKFASSFTVSVMVGDDIVPRLSPNNLRRLRKSLAYALAGSSSTKSELVAMCCCGNAFSASEKGRASHTLPSTLNVSEAEMELIVRMTKETFDEEQSASMRPPLRMYLLESMSLPKRGGQRRGKTVLESVWCAWPLHLLWDRWRLHSPRSLDGETVSGGPCDQRCASPFGLDSRPLRDVILSRDAIAHHMPQLVTMALASCTLPQVLADVLRPESPSALQQEVYLCVLRLFAVFYYSPATVVDRPVEIEVVQHSFATELRINADDAPVAIGVGSTIASTGAAGLTADVVDKRSLSQQNDAMCGVE